MARGGCVMAINKLSWCVEEDAEREFSNDELFKEIELLVEYQKEGNAAFTLNPISPSENILIENDLKILKTEETRRINEGFYSIRNDRIEKENWFSTRVNPFAKEDLVKLNF